MSPEAFKARLREEGNISGIFNWLVLLFARLKLHSDTDTAVPQTPFTTAALLPAKRYVGYQHLKLFY